MDWLEFRTYLIGELTPAFVAAFYIFSILGMIFSMLLHYDRKRRTNKKENKTEPFKLGFWVKDNFIRGLTNVVTIFVVIRFHKDLPIRHDLNMFLGLLVGLSIDVVIIMLRKYTRLNIFQSKK